LPVWPPDVESVAERVRASGVPAGQRALASASRSSGPVILEARDVRFRYEDQAGEALAGVDFTLREGEFVALIGANGSGKSTLARLVGGFSRASGSTPGARPLAALGAANAPPRSAAFQNPDDQIFAATVEEDRLRPTAGRLRARRGLVASARRRRSRRVASLERRDPFLLGKGDGEGGGRADPRAPTGGVDSRRADDRSDFREQRALMDALSACTARGRPW
jgi:hypothetical protein